MARAKYSTTAGKLFLTWVAMLTLAWVLIPGLAHAEIIPLPPYMNLDLGQKEPAPLGAVIPYAFNTDDLSTAMGAAVTFTGLFEGRGGVAGAVMASTNESRGVYLLGWDFPLPYTKRMFLDFNASLGYYSTQWIYAEAATTETSRRSGSNDSRPEDAIRGEGDTNWFNMRLRYVLPIGTGRSSGVHRYYLKKGLLAQGASGGETWNPLRSGISMLEFNPFWEERSMNLPDGSHIVRRTSGLGLAVQYNNTDFPSNPCQGSMQRLAFTFDPGVLGSYDTWATVEAQASKYFSLGNSRWFKQSVLALHFWTIDTPSWQSETVDGEVRISHRPPAYTGAVLGGFWRMRGYPQDRFTDRSAIYYCAELRLIPQWQPLPNISWLEFMEIDWWQVVFFGEAGRVADTWSLSELHSDMRWDLGVGLRFMIIKMIGRIDVGFSEEGVNAVAMVGHPF